MRILNIIQCTNLGGMEQANLLRLRGLLELGHECRLLSLNPIGKLGPLLQEVGIPHEGIDYRGRWGWRSLPEIRRQVTKFPCDAVLMTGHHFLTMLTLGRTFPPLRVLDMHNDHGSANNPTKWRLVYRVARSTFRAVTFPSDFARHEAEAIYPPIREITHTLRNPFIVPPLPDAAARTAARRRLGIDDDVPLIGNAGWLIPRKRFDVFIRVAARVLSDIPQARFLIAGDGPERDRLRALAQELGISSSIQWLGWQNDMETFFSAIDVLLFNAEWDALGRTPLEATSHGVPVVASVIHGGLGEILEHNVHGYLFPEHNIPALADRILFLLEHPEQARCMALAGRERLARLGSVRDNAQRMADLLAGKVH